MLRQESICNEETGLTDEEKTILDNLIKGESFVQLNQSGILPRQKCSPTVLSFAQQRLWIIDRLVSGNPFYNMSSIFRFAREIDPVVFERSLNEVVRRHESLRTVFIGGEEEPMQVILPDLKLTLHTIDLSHLGVSEQENELNRLAGEEFARPFDLEHGPLLRASLLNTGDNNHILLFTMHHIISDGWSMEVFIREMTTIYEAFSAGKPSPLPELSIQYADFALWQRQWLVGDVLEKQLSCWKTLLGGKLPVLELPTDHQRPAVRTYRGSICFFKVPGKLSGNLIELSRRQRSSLFMTLLAAFNVLLYRYTGQDDILVGSPAANRNRVELEELIGFFANTLVFRTDLSGSPVFLELLDRVNKVAAKAFDNQDLPFEKLIEELQPDRYMSHTPIFQVMFNFQNTPGFGGQSADFGKNVQGIHNKTSKFDLWVSMSRTGRKKDGKGEKGENGEKLAGRIEYNIDIFEHSTITRLIGHFITLLSGIVENPDRHIDDLPILLPGEKKQVLGEWNNTYREYSVGCLHHMFEKQVGKTPDRIAVVGTGQLTYNELDEISDGLAHLLMQRGIRADGVVAIMAERSMEMVIGLLGILKAGGAYLPLDPDYPGERIDYMLKDSGARVLIIAGRLVEDGEVRKLKIIDNNKSLQVIFLESSGYFLFSSGPVLNFSVFQPTNVAYVIYTSGSTGRPKGVLVSHEGISNRLMWMQEVFQINRDDYILQKTPFSFDVSVWEFFWPLINGAVLVMSKPGGHKDCAYLVKTIIKERITTIHFVPSMFQVFLEEPGIKDICLLRRVICSGEILPREYQQRFFDIFPGRVRLYNLYGPTEASVDVTYWQCRTGDNHRSIPIGQPVANTCIYIMDRNLNPVPIGIYGEIYIGGIQLSRGYINRPELTNKKFLQGSRGRFFQKESPGRRRQMLYKTGDLARWQPDGNIEYLGRLDFQVKVRGFRIELGEIESRLRDHPVLEEAVVLAVEDMPGAGDKKLAAYIIPKKDYWALLGRESGIAPDQQQVKDWRGVFNDTYSQEFPEPGSLFNILGWNSSYTGNPIPGEEMRQWVEEAVARILSLKPCRVLEIGCGTGLLLFGIIPFCEYYLGTDISAVGLEHIRRQLLASSQADKKHPARVELLQQPADDFRGIESGAFDLVIINSVVQYFPGIEYLLKVLKGAVRALKPGGRIFIGDVRNLTLLEAFHASVELYRARTDVAAGETDFGSITREQLKQKVMRRMYREKELVIDPGFFHALKGEEGFSGIKQARIHLKWGTFHNELTKFRYDVILEEGSGENPGSSIAFLDWQRDKLTLKEVRRILTETQPGYLGISGIPDARTEEDFRVLKWLRTQDTMETPGQIPESPVSKQKIGVDPVDFRGMGEEVSYDQEIYISLLGSSGDNDKEYLHLYDVVFRRRGVAGGKGGIDVVRKTGTGKEKKKRQSWGAYANNPLESKMTAELELELKDFLKEKLPAYMVPSHFILLKTLPLGPNGKLDRGALPRAFQISPGQDREFVEPGTGIEKLFADIWLSVLNLEKIGITDNFFEMGGDSIKAIQIISRINKQGYNLSLKDLYRDQCIVDLARYAAGMKNQPPKGNGREEEGIVDDDFYSGIDMEKMAHCLTPGIEIEDIYPVTPLQYHMLNYYKTHVQNESGLFVFRRNSPRLYMNLDISLLEQAMQQVTAHNPLLRTVFVREELKEPVQVVCKQGEIGLIYQDLSGLSADESDRRFEELMSNQWNCEFDLKKPLTLCMLIVKLAEGVFKYGFTGDYIRIDGWSANAVINQILNLYFAQNTGRSVELPGENNVYKDYLFRLRKQDTSEAKKYWQRTLKEFSGPTPLVSRFPGNETGQGEGFARQHIYLPAQISAEFKRLLRKHQLVLSTVGQAIWALLLGSYTNERDLVFGVLSSGRSIASAGVETMIGYSINVLPVRVKIEPDELVINWLKLIWKNHVEWSQYEYTRIDHINDWCGKPRELPLFESYIVIQNLPKGSGNTEEKPAVSKSSHLFHARMEYPLRFDIYPLQEMCFVLTYYRNCFVDEVIKGLLDNLQAVLESMVKNPDQTVGRLMSQIEPGKYRKIQTQLDGEKEFFMIT